MLVLAAMALVAPGAMAVQVQTVGGYGPWQTNQGGEFTLKAISGELVTALSYYNSYTKNQYTGPNAIDPLTLSTPNFQTFCVEGTEYIFPNSPYDVTISDVTIFNGKKLTAGAAWLYSQFAGFGNTLAGYDYNDGDNIGIGRHVSADLLQKAIWMFMGQEGQTLINNAGNDFVKEAIKVLGITNAFLANSEYGNYNVAVLNLWVPDAVYRDSGKRQDQLILTAPVELNSEGFGGSTVPDGGFTVALLGLSLIGLVALRRRCGQSVRSC